MPLLVALKMAREEGYITKSFFKAFKENWKQGTVLWFITIVCSYIIYLDFMLRHNMFQWLSDGKPISAHITDIMFPQSYALSLTDLTYIASKRQLTAEQNCTPLLRLLQEKQKLAGQWKIDYIYNYQGYAGFETRRKTSEWISALFSIWLFIPK